MEKIEIGVSIIATLNHQIHHRMSSSITVEHITATNTWKCSKLVQTGKAKSAVTKVTSTISFKDDKLCYNIGIHSFECPKYDISNFNGADARHVAMVIGFSIAGLAAFDFERVRNPVNARRKQ